MRKGVNLMTMHSAKGLEFDTVYILDAVEEITPYKRQKRQRNSKRNGGCFMWR